MRKIILLAFVTTTFLFSSNQPIDNNVSEIFGITIYPDGKVKIDPKSDNDEKNGFKQIYQDREMQKYKQASEKMIKDQQELMNKIKKENFNHRNH